ncbi:hypothetical protein GCM10027047_38140 [Rhodococcus aerolatus]
MSRLAAAHHLDLPPAAVSGAVRSVEVLRSSVRDAGHEAEVVGRRGGLLVPGDEVVFRLAVLGAPVEVAVRLTRSDLREQVSTLLRAPRLVAGGGAALDHRTALVGAGGGTSVRDDVTWTAPWGPLGRLADLLVLRRVGRGVLAARHRAVTSAARLLAAAEGTQVVAAGAVVDRGHLLVARRTWPVELAGLWELPGGGVDPGETAAGAVAREIREELNLAVDVAGQVGADVPLADGRVLRAHLARLRGGEPVLREHSEVRWVGAAELAGLEVVEADRGWLPDLAPLLAP